MAVAAVDAVIADVMLMAEGHGLLDRGKRGRIRAGIDAVDDRRRNERGEDAEPEQLEAENRRRREDLCHAVACVRPSAVGQSRARRRRMIHAMP